MSPQNEREIPPAFLKFTPGEIRDLEAGPLNVGWLLQGISHAALENLPEDVMADITRYAENPHMPSEERHALSRKIQAAIKAAGDRYFSAQ